LYREGLVIPDVNKNDIIRGQARWVKMMPARGKLTALVWHLTKKVNTIVEITYLSTKI
jgi:hypothetical protein